jgi:nicotinate-nucleotide--dimethylbenzimidazole phosphoribosyltransferase
MLHRNLVIRSIGQGTGNIARGPAMSLEQAEQTVIAGVEIVEGEIERGLDIVAMGDMGVGNTTAAAAICAAITGENPERIVDRGSGLDDAGLQRKIATVRRALLANNPDAGNGLDILAKVGGYEIGGLAGAILGAAVHRKPVLLDGVASTAAAMIAATLAPRVRPYLIASHHSESNVHGHMLDWLGLKPLISLNLTLGEGAGAALTFSIIEAACKLLTEMATLTEAGIPT